MYEVAVYDDDPNGIATVIISLLKTGLGHFPNRRNIARQIPRPVAVHSPETGETVSIVFFRDQALVFNDLVGRPAVVIKATEAQILEMAQVGTRARGLLPVGFFAASGRRIALDLLLINIPVKGLFTHTATFLRFIALISVAGQIAGTERIPR